MLKYKSMDIIYEQAIELLRNSKISLEKVSKASLVCSAFNIQEYVILHAGPDIAYNDMNIVMKQAIQVAIMYEGWAKGVHEAEILASSNKIKYLSSASYSFSSRGAGIISPSMPVMVFKNETNNRRAYATIADGYNKSMNYGYLSNESIMRLKWIDEVLIKDMVNSIDVTCILHNSISKEVFINEISKDYSSDTIDFVRKDSSFYYSILFGALKCLLLGIDNLDCNIISAISSNGNETLLKVNGHNHIFKNNLLEGNINHAKELILGDFYPGRNLIKSVDMFLDTGLKYKLEVISSIGGLGTLRNEEISVNKSVLYEILESQH